MRPSFRLLCIGSVLLTGILSPLGHADPADRCALLLDGAAPLGVDPSEWQQITRLVRRYKNLQGVRDVTPKEMNSLSLRITSETKRHGISFDSASMALTAASVPVDVLAACIMRWEYWLIQDLVDKIQKGAFPEKGRSPLEVQLAQLEERLLVRVDRATGVISPLRLSFDIGLYRMPRHQVSVIRNAVRALNDASTPLPELPLYRAQLTLLEQTYLVMINRTTGKIRNR